MSLGADDVLIVNSTDPMPVITEKCLAAAGDLVLVQINLQTSVEGYTLRDDNSSHFPDPSLSGNVPFVRPSSCRPQKRRKDVFRFC